MRRVALLMDWNGVTRQNEETFSDDTRPMIAFRFERAF